MGLLTGFSLISGVEIVYFASKFVLNVFRNVPFLVESIPQYLKDHLDHKIDNLHSADDGEPSEETHGASNS